MKKNRQLVLIVYLILLLSGPITILMNTPVVNIFKNDIVLLNYFQRVFGTLAFVMLFGQIVLGSELGKWIKAMGSKAYKYHVTHGLATYALVLIHPLMQMAIDINLRGPLAGLLTLLPGVDIYLNFGKLALLFITTGVLVGYFRTKPFLRRNWRKLHILNYLAFIFVAVHSWNLGTDVKSFPFVATFFLANVVVNALIIRKLYLLLIGNWGRIFSPPETN